MRDGRAPLRWGRNAQARWTLEHGWGRVGWGGLLPARRWRRSLSFAAHVTLEVPIHVLPELLSLIRVKPEGTRFALKRLGFVQSVDHGLRALGVITDALLVFRTRCR